MATITHPHILTMPDDPAVTAAGGVTPSKWNEDHTLVLGADENFASDAEISAIHATNLWHGFVNRTSSSIPSAPYAGTVFTLTKNSNYTTYIGGVIVPVTATLTCDLSAQPSWTGTAADYGQWFITMTGAGVLAASMTPWSILDETVIPVSIVHWDGTTSVPSEERHSYKRDLIEHDYKHSSFGAVYRTGFTPSPTFGAGAANTFSFVGGIINDEDIANNSITLDSGGSPHTNCSIGYRTVNALASGGTSMTFDARGTAYAKLSAGEPVWDNAGTLTALGVSKYGIEWIYATNRPGTPIAVIVGQGEYANVAAAQSASTPSLGNMNVAEWKLLYRVIVRNVAGALSFVQADTMYNLSTGPAISVSVPAPVVDISVITEGRSDPSVVNAGTSTLNLALGRSFKLDASALAAGNAFTVALSNVPVGTNLIAVTVLLKIGTNIPTVTWPTGVTAPTLVASKTAWYTLATEDNGTTWRIFSAGAF